MATHHVVPFDTGHHEAVNGLLLELPEASGSPLAPLAYSEGVVAVTDHCLTGVAIGLQRPSLRGLHDCFTLQLYVASAYRRQGIASRLLTRLQQHLEARGRPVVTLVVCAPTDPAAVGFLQARGFAKYDELLHYETPLPLRPQVPLAPVRPWHGTIQEYGGEEPALNQQLADLFNRAYRRALTISPANAEAIGRSLQPQGARCCIGVEREGVGGFATWESLPERRAHMSGVAVRFRHWGTGLADALGLQVGISAHEAGADALCAEISSANHASRRLAKRLGWHVVGSTARYMRPL